MTLDRNKNPDRSGKYALLKMRNLNPILYSTIPDERSIRIAEAFAMLANEGMIHFGNESPGEQFFVMKFKDKFTAPALRAYAMAAREEAHRIWLSVIDTSATILGGEPLAPEDKERRSNAVAAYRGLIQYANELDKESFSASKLGCRIPD